MTWLRSLAFNIGYLGFTALFAIFLIPSLLLPRRVLTRAGRVWARVVNALLESVIGATIEVRGRERLPRGACVVACKHQSAWETIALNGLLADPCFVLKRELTWIPLFGWYLLKRRLVVVDRRGGARALNAMLRDARAAVDAGRQIVIFPEGTRVAPGTTRPYQPGVAALYRHLGVPVVPVALNSGLVWGRRSFVKRPGRIILGVLAAIPPGLDRAEFAARLEHAIETETRTLEAEAEPARELSR
jgi:1-acyl-sn-glycerol-3-phosphate acyltransferase